MGFDASLPQTHALVAHRRQMPDQGTRRTARDLLGIAAQQLTGSLIDATHLVVADIHDQCRHLQLLNPAGIAAIDNRSRRCNQLARLSHRFSGIDGAAHPGGDGRVGPARSTGRQCTGRQYAHARHQAPARMTSQQAAKPLGFGIGI